MHRDTFEMTLSFKYSNSYAEFSVPRPLFLGETEQNTNLFILWSEQAPRLWMIIIMIIIKLVEIIRTISKEHELWSQAACVHMPTLPPTCRVAVTLHNSACLSLSFLTWTMGMIVSTSEVVKRVLRTGLV